MTAPTARRDFGPVQLADHLGLARWQLDRALADGLIPGPDRARGRWSAPIADAALAGIEAIRAAAGPIPIWARSAPPRSCPGGSASR